MKLSALHKEVSGDAVNSKEINVLTVLPHDNKTTEKNG